MQSGMALVYSPPPPPPSRHLCEVTAAVGRAVSGNRALMQRRPSPRLVAAQSLPPLAAGGVRREAELGLASLLFVLTVVMGSFLSLAIISIPAWSAFKQMEVAAHKLSKVVSEEVPGTLSSLKLCCLEISDFTSQLKNLRKILPVNRFGRKS